MAISEEEKLLWCSGNFNCDIPPILPFLEIVHAEIAHALSTYRIK